MSQNGSKASSMPTPRSFNLHPAPPAQLPNGETLFMQFSSSGHFRNTFALGLDHNFLNFCICRGGEGSGWICGASGCDSSPWLHTPSYFYCARTCSPAFSFTPCGTGVSFFPQLESGPNESRRNQPTRVGRSQQLARARAPQPRLSQQQRQSSLDPKPLRRGLNHQRRTPAGDHLFFGMHGGNSNRGYCDQIHCKLFRLAAR
jgi:hypothetical protein